MPRYAVFGAGMMGRVVAEDLLTSEDSATVGLFDSSEDLLRESADRIGDPRLATEQLDATVRDDTVRALERHDVAIGALPHGLSLNLVEAAIAAKTSLVDLVGEAPEKRRALADEARDAGCLVIPGCGVAPGISNFCVGQGMELLDDTERAAIYVGGIPRSPEPPLFYETVYLLESVLAAYRRKATIRREGREVEVQPLSGLEALEFPRPIGKLEAFYTDGLGSLPLTVGSRVRTDLYEKTLRHPGHVAGVRFLEQCGLLSSTPVVVGESSVAPVAVLQKVLESKLQLGPDGDILVMRVIVEGRRRGRPVAHTFELVDFYDSDRHHTAMARTTGYTAACAARRIAGGDIHETGVRFPEELFLGDRFTSMVTELDSKGVRVEHRERDIPQEAG